MVVTCVEYRLNSEHFLSIPPFLKVFRMCMQKINTSNMYTGPSLPTSFSSFDPGIPQNALLDKKNSFALIKKGAILLRL
jgi:hypothetical protein